MYFVYKIRIFLATSSLVDTARHANTEITPYLKQSNLVSEEIKQLRQTIARIGSKLDLINVGASSSQVHNFKLPIDSSEELKEVLNILKQEENKNELVRINFWKMYH